MDFFVPWDRNVWGKENEKIEKYSAIVVGALGRLLIGLVDI